MTPEEVEPLRLVAERLGYSFENPDLLDRALVHSSYQAEHPEVPDNERLEFLGDAVLGLAVASHLFASYPDMSEGEMAKVRAAAVSREALTEIASKLQLGDFVRLGRGEDSSGGRYKSSILANTMEAVIAAVYLDGGFEAARQVVLRHWQGALQVRVHRPGGADFKTRLQELLAAAGLRPEYRVEGFGPDHNKRFVATLLVGGEERSQGSGRSKREAEQEAARAAIEELGGPAPS
ncbi:MAG TPA: ribonuclease III [Acidimicrobiia bacterium]|nr:ribonuclease III [Acidimicrobiia bacterium]